MTEDYTNPLEAAVEAYREAVESNHPSVGTPDGYTFTMTVADDVGAVMQAQSTVDGQTKHVHDPEKVIEVLEGHIDWMERTND